MRVLGVSPFHDSSVAIINNGIIEKFYKEERLTKKKRDGAPFASLKKVIESGVKIDYACIASPTHFDGSLAMLRASLSKFFNVDVKSYCETHHLAHASLAFYNSGFEDCLVFVIDRNGSVINNVMREAETVFRASYPVNFTTLHKNYWLFNRGNDADLYNFEEVHNSPPCNFSVNVDSTMSVVRVYESATTLIGQHPLENGKTMGLSAYGRDTQLPYKLFVDGRPNDGLFINGFFVKSKMPSTLMLNHKGRINANVTEENYQFYADHAYQVQKQTQEFVCNFINEWVEKTGIKKVCVTGGYALNVVANGYYTSKMPEVEFYFEPLADDSGNSIGAAMHLYRSLTGDKQINKIPHTFFHGDINDNTPSVGSPCTERDIANFILDNKVVAVFSGKAEAGPRALGNRSILFNARNENAKQIVNRVKKREWYRPFSAMVLKDDFSLYFDNMHLDESKYMTLSFYVKNRTIPGVTHVDNSCRVQTIDTDIPHIFNLLSSLKEMCGCSVVLNTSFNLAGEPLIESLDDAIATFNKSDIDVLWFPETQTLLSKN